MEKKTKKMGKNEIKNATDEKMQLQQENTDIVKNGENFIQTNAEHKPNTELLQCAYTNIQTGMKGIEYLLPESQSMEFSSFLLAQQKSYKSLYEKAQELSKKHEIKIKENSWFKNAKMWINIKLSSFGVDDTQQLSKLIIIGNFFGVIDMISALSNIDDAKQDIVDFARKVKSLEEDCINGLIPYLERAKK